MSIERKCANCAKESGCPECDCNKGNNYEDFTPREEVIREDERENYIEYVKQLSNLFGKQELYQQLLEELVHCKWPIITKDKLIKFLLEREHKIDEIIKEN